MHADGGALWQRKLLEVLAELICFGKTPDDGTSMNSWLLARRVRGAHRESFEEEAAFRRARLRRRLRHLHGEARSHLAGAPRVRRCRSSRLRRVRDPGRPRAGVHPQRRGLQAGRAGLLWGRPARRAALPRSPRDGGGRRTIKADREQVHQLAHPAGMVRPGEPGDQAARMPGSNPRRRAPRVSPVARSPSACVRLRCSTRRTGAGSRTLSRVASHSSRLALLEVTPGDGHEVSFGRVRAGDRDVQRRIAVGALHDADEPLDAALGIRAHDDWEHRSVSVARDQRVSGAVIRIADANRCPVRKSDRRSSPTPARKAGSAAISIRDRTTTTSSASRRWGSC
jgi:hypothetical protein